MYVAPFHSMCLQQYRQMCFCMVGIYTYIAMIYQNSSMSVSKTVVIALVYAYVAGRSVSRGCKGVDDLECVTDENLSQYSIQDLVVPLPGYDVMYPKNEGQI